MRKNSVPRGRNLKINTYERVRIEKPASDTTSEANTSESLAEASSDAEKAVTETVAAVASDTTSTSSTKSKGGFTNHKVKKGESLYRIAKAKGTTVEAIQKANGMSGSAIREGQTLKIPR